MGDVLGDDFVWGPIFGGILGLDLGTTSGRFRGDLGPIEVGVGATVERAWGAWGELAVSEGVPQGMLGPPPRGQASSDCGKLADVESPEHATPASYDVPLSALRGGEVVADLLRKLCPTGDVAALQMMLHSAAPECYHE